MKAALVGRGAIGLLYATQMKEHGIEPLFIVDEERRQRYEETPILVNGDSASFRYESQGEPVDLILIMTKAGGLQAALEEIRPFVGPQTILLSCLNGITSEDIVRRAFPDNPVIRTIVQGMDTVFLQGECQFSHIGEILIGPENPEDEPVIRELESFFASMGMPCRVCEDIVREQWNKLMLNCGVNQICAVYGCGYGGAVGEYRDLFIRVMQEVQSVAAARGIQLEDADIERWLQICEQLDPESMPSMAQDIQAGRKTELSLFSGTVVPLAQEAGIPVPELEQLQRQILVLEADMRG